MNSDVKLGTQSVGGVYVKDTQLLKFDISQLGQSVGVASDFIAAYTANNKITVANLSDVNITLKRGTDNTDIPSGHIEWYSLDSRGYVLYNTSSKRLRTVYLDANTNTNIEKVNFGNSVVDSGGIFNSGSSNSVPVFILIFNA